VNKVAYLNPHFAVTGVLQAADFRQIADLGFKSVLSNLPDGESNSYLSASEEAELANSAGLGFRHVPAIKSEVLGDRVVDAVGQALAQLEGPVLAHCASGIRSAIAWAAAAARTQPADCVIAALKNAGYDLAVLRDELEDQRGRAHVASTPAALDCHCKEQGEGVV
jgi:sulfide:quinone oxidoreductase